MDVALERIGDIDVGTTLVKIRRDRESAAELERAATESAAELAKVLAAADIPVRDIGAVMGVSFQRAHQLVKS